jgi:transposase
MTIVGLWKGFYGSCAQERRGETCRKYFGKWSTVWKRFRRWALKGVLEKVSKPYLGTRLGVRAHRRRKRGTQNQAIGKSRGGLTTKVLALVDALGSLVRFVLLPGQRHDSIGVMPLIAGIDFKALIADEAFDNNAIRAELDERGALVVIPSQAHRKPQIPHDKEMYKWRHLIENYFQLLKEFRHIATRYAKTDTSFATALYLAAAIPALR